jgi:hypothetical protein
MAHILRALVAWGVLLSTAHALDITSCGQVVPRRETGVLTGDLDCTATGGTPAVSLENGATL